MHAVSINYLAVVVAAAAAFVIGGLWYSPLLFAKLWVKSHGFSAEQVAAMQKKAGPAYGATVLLSIIMGLVIATLVSYTGAATILDGLWLGLLCWLGFAVTIGLTNTLFSGKKISTFLIDVGYQFVYIVAMTVILTVWR